ncbi:uncharacterized protein PRCAT00005069001, partial [Priceomyces carsonii]|uniref:uncharacterized protein n=1 Tax=Priceomyces carsonii TaxID=28549 RepID=UPI002EDABDBC
MSNDLQNLEGFLKVKGPAMRSYYDEILSYSSSQETKKVLKVETDVEGRSGIRRIKIRNHQILADSPKEWCGYNLGASAPEMLLGSLTACISHMYLVVAGMKRISLVSLSVEASGSLDLRNGMKGFENKVPGIEDLNYTVHIESNENDEVLRSLHQEVEKICPLYVS